MCCLTDVAPPELPTQQNTPPLQRVRLFLNVAQRFSDPFKCFPFPMILINFSSRFLISETSSSSDQRSHGPLDDTRMQIADWSKQNPKPEKKNKKKTNKKNFTVNLC